MTMTNFHAAAPICSPSRASIMTGLFSWRAGIGGVYEYGKKDGHTNRNDWMNRMPTAAMAFRDAGYYTAHVGKWHLGGMRETDIDERVQEGTCSHPGPNQQGFQEYVSIAEGPDDPRQGSYLQRQAMLHTVGGKYMYRNDKPHKCSLPSLSNCEAQEALRIMKEVTDRNESFFMNVWFEQPHGPWNLMPDFVDWYGGLRKLDRSRRNDCYKTMVSAMDESLGRILKGLHDMNLEQNTIVVFTSDNGPEIGAGSTAGFKNRKRYLHEGGIRVPCVWQWPGHLKEGAVIADFGVGVDLYPTFLEATGVAKPNHVKLDGMSLLPFLAPTSVLPRNSPTAEVSDGSSKNGYRALLARPQVASSSTKISGQPVLKGTSLHSRGPNYLANARFGNPKTRKIEDLGKYGKFSANEILRSKIPTHHAELDLETRIWELHSRVSMWYVQFEHPVSAAAISHGFKIITGEDHLPIEIYDLSSDAFEEANLIRQTDHDIWIKQINDSSSRVVSSKKRLFVDFESGASRDAKIDKLMQNVMPALYYFSKYGNAANLLYLKKNFNMHIWPNPENKKTVKLTNANLIGKCGVPNSSDVPTLPFEHTDHKLPQAVRPLDYYQMT